MDRFLILLGMNRQVSIRIQTILTFIIELFLLLRTQNISIETFHKWQDEVIAGFNKKMGWLLTLQKLVMVLKKVMSVVVTLLQ